MLTHHTTELLAADRMAHFERTAREERVSRSLRPRRRPATDRGRTALDRAELRKAA